MTYQGPWSRRLRLWHAAETRNIITTPTTTIGSTTSTQSGSWHTRGWAAVVKYLYSTTSSSSLSGRWNLVDPTLRSSYGSNFGSPPRSTTTALSSFSSSSSSSSTTPSSSSSESDPLHDDMDTLEPTARKTTTGSLRGLRAVQLLPSYLADARSVTKYHATNSPQGALQLGVAESLLMEKDWLVPALNHHHPASSSSPSSMVLPANAIYYQPTHGRVELRQALADYIQHDLLPSLVTPEDKAGTSRSISADHLVVGAGCNAALENLCLCLAEAGEAVLIPTPYYAAFEFDLAARIDLYVQPVTTESYQNTSTTTTALSSSSSYQAVQSLHPSRYYPNRAALDAAYERALEAGHAPRILLLSHPQNPLGICYPVHVVQECMDWCRQRQVHLISDEIYAGSVYGPRSGFQSVLQMNEGAAWGPYIHWVYALSKDFALSGLRVGAVYTENTDILLPLQKLNDLCQISSTTQLMVADLLQRRVDPADATSARWTQAFRQENHGRLQARVQALTAVLDEFNISYLVPTAGLFLWMDLSAFLPASNADTTPASRERELYLELVHTFGLLFTPGLSMRNEQPGFFRCVFTAATDEEFELSLQRIRTFALTKTR